MMHDPDDYRTPQYVLDWISEYIGEITHDGACNELMLSRSGIWSPEPNSVATPIDIVNLERDLYKPMHVFINPPWDTFTVCKLVHRAALIHNVENTMTFTFLLPNKLCNKAWVEQVLPYLDHIIFLGGRINFEGPNAAPAAKSRHGCFLGIIDSKRNRRYHGFTVKKIKQEVRDNANW